MGAMLTTCVQCATYCHDKRLDWKYDTDVDNLSVAAAVRDITVYTSTGRGRSKTLKRWGPELNFIFIFIFQIVPHFSHEALFQSIYLYFKAFKLHRH